MRHVSSHQTNQYWKRSISSIRRYFGRDTHVVVIDDNSDFSFLMNDIENITVVYSEYPGRGEILPYYYFYRYHWFDKAIIIHDSVFFQTKLDTSGIDDVKFFWDFTHDWDNIDREKNLLSYLNHSDELYTLYDNKDKWRGAFGGMSVISHSFLSQVEKKYKLFRLLHHIKERSDRMCFERIISLIATNLW